MGLLMACPSPPSGDGKDGGTDAGTQECIAPTKPSSSTAEVGNINVELHLPTIDSNGQPTPGRTSVTAQVFDAPKPQLVEMVTKATAGDCKLLTPKIPFCSMDCCGGASCVATDTCQGNPEAQNMGEITVTGVKTASSGTVFTLKNVNNNYQALVALDYPPFDEDAPVRVDADGGVYGSFAIESRGIAPINLTSTSLVLSGSSDLAVTWTPAGSGTTSRILIELEISHHGGRKGSILCDTADDGALNIDKSLVASLVSLGVAGWPTIKVKRNSAGTVTIAPGKVNLSVFSQIETNVQVPGYVSCFQDCPDGGGCSSYCDGGLCKEDLTCE